MRYDDAPTLEATVSLLSDALDIHGAKTGVAALMGLAVTTINKQCDDKENYKGWYYQFKRFLWACFKVNPAVGERIFRDLSCAVETWRTKDKACETSPGRLTGALIKEVADIAAAEIDNKPIDEVIAEACEARDRLNKKIDALVRTKQLDEGSRFVGSVNYTKVG